MPCPLRHHPNQSILTFHEQEAVKQSVILESFREQFMDPLGLRGPDDIDARLLYMDRYRTAHPCHVQSPATPCREQLLYELSVSIAVGGVEHAHDLVHQDDHATGIVVVRQQERFGSEVGHDGTPQHGFLFRMGRYAASSGGVLPSPGLPTRMM